MLKTPLTMERTDPDSPCWTLLGTDEEGVAWGMIYDEAAELMRAANSHAALVEAVKELLAELGEAPDWQNTPHSVEHARAALAQAGGGA
jgi:hypothetical protein